MVPDPLLERVERALLSSKMKPTAFGWAAVKDPRFVFELRAGRECRRATREKVVAYIESLKREAEAKIAAPKRRKAA